MPAPRFVTDVVSSHTEILLTRSYLPLSSEIIRQLNSYKQIHVTGITDPNTASFPTANFSLIVHFAGFENSSYAETLYHTTTVHKLMDLALASRGKFVLVTSEAKTALQETAVNLVTQFGKNFNLDYRIVVIPQGLSIAESAEAVIKVFLKHHVRVAPVTIVPAPKSVAHKPEPVKPAIKKSNNPWPLILLLLILSPWAVLLLQVLLLTVGVACMQRSWESNYTSNKTCAQVVVAVSKNLQNTSTWLPGSGKLMSTVGWPGGTVVATQKIAQVYLQVNGISEISGRLTYNFLTHKDFSTKDMNKVWSLSEELLDKIVTFELQSGSSERLRSWKSLLGETKVEIGNLLAGRQNLADLLAMSGQKKLLLLVQDNLELRPTGGLIDTIALATIDRGRVGDIQTYNVSSLDGMLRGQVAPPTTLQKATGQQSWFLRESNWSADFKEAAPKAAWFVGKELGESSEIIVGVNLSTLRDVLGVIGPVTISGITVDSGNMYEQYLATLRANSTDSRFIGQLLEQILVKLQSVDLEKSTKLAQIVFSQVTSRNMLTYPEVINNQKTGQEVFIVNSNVGVNKADYWVHEKYHLDVTFNSDSVDSQYSLSYTNTSLKSAWPEGVYKNYLRLYLPTQQALVQVSVDGHQLAADKFSLTTENGEQILAMSLEVPLNSSKTVTVLTKEKRVGQGYQVNWLNQPGQGEVPTEVTINYPSAWRVVANQTAAVASEGQLGYNTSLLKPYSLSLQITPNGR